MEDVLAHSPNIIAQIFMLKGLRPKFRDTYKDKPTSPQVVELLVKLREAAQTPVIEEVEVKRLTGGQEDGEDNNFPFENPDSFVGDK